MGPMVVLNPDLEMLTLTPGMILTDLLNLTPTKQASIHGYIESVNSEIIIIRNEKAVNETSAFIKAEKHCEYSAVIKDFLIEDIHHIKMKLIEIDYPEVWTLLGHNENGIVSNGKTTGRKPVYNFALI